MIHLNKLVTQPFKSHFQEYHTNKFFDLSSLILKILAREEPTVHKNSSTRTAPQDS